MGDFIALVAGRPMDWEYYGMDKQRREELRWDEQKQQQQRPQDRNGAMDEREYTDMEEMKKTSNRAEHNSWAPEFYNSPGEFSRYLTSSVSRSVRQQQQRPSSFIIVAAASRTDFRRWCPTPATSACVTNLQTFILCKSKCVFDTDRPGLIGNTSITI